MKKKLCKLFAMIMAILTVTSAFAVVPAMAADAKSYDIAGTTEKITIDGKANEAIWSQVQSSDVFVNTSTKSIDGFTASYKAVWSPNAEDSSKMDVYIFITATGYTVQYSWRNNIRVQIESADASVRFWSGQQQLGNVNTGSVDREATVGSNKVPFKLWAVNSIGSTQTATYEFCYTMPKADKIKLDVLVNAKTSSSDDTDSTYSWASTNCNAAASASLGIGNILPIPTYDIARSMDEITVDGKADEAIWSEVQSSSAFVNTSEKSIDGFTATYKAVWRPNAEDSTKMDIYIFVTATGYTVQYSWRNNIRVQIESADASVRFWSGQQQLGNVNTGSVDREATVGSNKVPFKLWAVNSIGSTQTATYEFCYTMPKADKIKLDVLVNAKTGSSDDTDSTYSWVSTNCNAAASASLGVGNIKNFDFSDVAATTKAGASIRIDTADKTKSGIRFETSVNADAVAALIAKGATVTTGTLVLPTDFLSAKSVDDKDFTIEGLKAAGMIEGTDYYNIVNVGNEWVDGSVGTWFGTIYNIKNFTRRFSGVGYVTIELDGEAFTYYGGYATANARSIAEVAEILMDGEIVGDDGNWTAAQEEVLLGFYQAEN